MYTVNVIGCGKVGKTLAARIHQTGAGKIQDLYSRSSPSAYAAAEFIGVGHAVTELSSMREADFWIIAVPDSQISAASLALAVASSKTSAPLLDMPVAFHCSGFESSVLLEPLRSKGFRIASLHPVLSFADPALSTKMFEGIPCGIEGDPDAIKILGGLVDHIGGKGFELSPKNKGLYHAAAVFSSNLNVVLQSVAVEAWHAAGVPQEMISILHAALLGATTNNLLQMGPAKALTGPAARGDEHVVRRQHEMVECWHPEAGLIYDMLSKLAARLATSGRTLPEQASSPDNRLS